MAKKEFKIGEEFQFGLVKLRVVEEDENSCFKCFFNGKLLCGCTTEVAGSCYPDEREDNKSVVFVKVEGKK